MATEQQPHVLYTIPGVKAYHIADGEEANLCPSGPQELSMLMISTSSQTGQDASATVAQALEHDYHLHLTLPPELELPMLATTHVFHQSPNSYLIPRADQDGAFTRLEFPAKTKQEDIDTFETIIAQCTAFLERAPTPKHDEPLPPYNATDISKGDTFKDTKGHGQIVLIDEDNGSIVGELAESAHVHEDAALKYGTKNPVEVEISADGKRVDVRPVDQSYLDMANHPAYKDSNLVKNAATASRLIVTGSSYIGNMLTSGADSFVQKTKPADKAVEFKPATHERVRKINAFTQGAVGLSGKTVGQVSKYTQNMGAALTRRGERKPGKGLKEGGEPDDAYKPGLLNKSMIAFSTIADGIALSGKSLLTQSSVAASQVVEHKYGQEAGSIASGLAGGVKNVGLVYIDVTGVSRKAVIKSVAKGMVVGKVRGGGQVMVGGGDGGQMPSDMKDAADSSAPTSGQMYDQKR